MCFVNESSMGYKGSCVLQRRNGTCFYLLQISGRIQCNAFSINRTFCSQKSPPDKPLATQEQTSAALKNMTKLGKQWGQNTVKTATATVNHWWEKYEEFVGLSEVKDAQSKVTEVCFNLLIFLISSSVINPNRGCVDVL